MKINGYYINLEHRRDRNKHFIDNIKKYDFFSEIKRYGAIYNKECGAIGCVKSHINVLELCLQQNDNYYLIMEDDFSVFHENNLSKFIDKFTSIKNENWDIITLTPSGTTIKNDTIKDYCRIKNNLATSGYIIKKDKINILLDNFKESLKLLIETGNVKRYILDKHWFKIQDEVKFYYFKDLFGTQLNGFSDIKNDYSFNRDKLFISNDYKKILLDEYLITFINEPYNDMNNFNLAFEYEEIGQTAAALSYYLRCAEFTENTDLSYECMLRMSKCLTKQGNRDNKELTCITHAITIDPNRTEAYYIISLYYSFRKNWLKSYMYACIGLQNINNEYRPLLKDIGYFNNYQLLFQKAYSGYNKGKINESREIYYDLLNNHNINNHYKKIVNHNLDNFPGVNHKIIKYTKDKYNLLKYKFSNSENVDENYSQIYQDIFVLSMYGGKMKGTYLEIGSGDPFYGNNTYLLEKNYDWKGISIDINEYSCNLFNKNRKNKCININAADYDYKELLEHYGNEIDYLQLDCDPPNITYDILLKIPFDKIKFGVITYEHDYYNDRTKSYRQKSREHLLSKGYKLIVGNISPDRNNNPFEDWWIHPDLIDESIYKLFIYKEMEYINGEDYMLVKDDITIFDYHKNKEAYLLKYFDSNFVRSINDLDKLSITEPISDVIQFPIVTDVFCKELIDICEKYGRWSEALKEDKRIGYENVPSNDIHFTEIYFHELWEELIKTYIAPIISYHWGPYLTNSLNIGFVVKYEYNKFYKLEPHHDSSAYTINISLNDDYDGGEINFVKNKEKIKNKKGYALIHPGKITHYHEGLPVIKGTKYINVSFVN